MNTFPFLTADTMADILAAHAPGIDAPQLDQCAYLLAVARLLPSVDLQQEIVVAAAMMTHWAGLDANAVTIRAEALLPDLRDILAAENLLASLAHS